ncbi:MAG: tetratricopeptide repeat protein [Anaerolineales bacterium]|nr:tetratricopeptide repeat protein [Anaerolineales bacterium]
MDTPISRTKIALPTHRAEWLTRPRLLEFFYELLEFKLILITAPAGYGKTTFMADVAHRLDIPTCWFALDEMDQDLNRFIAHFIAAIETRFPGFGVDSRSELRRGSQINLDRLTTILVNEAYAHVRDHFLFVLDDYYLVEVNPEVRQFVSLFVQKSDENCHVAILTRKLPDLPDLTLLVGRTQVGGLSFRELAFTPEEIQAFIQQNYREEISDGLARELFEQTEGWITGLLLSAQSQLSGLSKQGRVSRVTGIDLSAYLMAQVLKQQPDYLCQFLLQTSLLEEFNRQFCEQVLGTPPSGHRWQDLIYTVVEKNLFIQPLENGWVRYHHLFRDFLQAQIAQNDPENYRCILYKLATIYAEQGEWEKSRTIYQRLGDQKAIAGLIEEVSPTMAAGGRYKTLAKWIDELPFELRFSRPAMLSLRGITAVMLGDAQDGIEFLNQAANLFRQTDPKGLAQTLTRRGMAFLMAGNYTEALANAQEALSLLGDGADLTHAEALRVIGLCQQRLGDYEVAVQHLEKARLVFVFLGDQRREAIALSDLGMMYRALGQHHQAETAYQNALSFWRKVESYSHAAITANNLGVFFHLRGDYRQAATYLEEAISYAHRSGDGKGLSYASLGDLYADLKISEAARSAYQTARIHANRLQDKYLLLYLDLAEAQVAYVIGGEAFAQPFLDSAQKTVAQSQAEFQHGAYELTVALVSYPTKLEAAETALKAALGHFSNQAPSNEIILAHFYMAVVQHQLKQPELASQHLIQTLELSQKLGNPQPLIVAAAEQIPAIEAISVPSAFEFAKHQLLENAISFNQQLPTLRRLLRKKEMSIPVDPPKIVIQGLGANRVIVDGREITGPDWQTVKARDIFFFILEHAGGVSREKIEAAFWPEASSAQLSFIFKKTMYRLRRAFASDPIIFTGDRYSFDFKGDYEYDVEEWERALKQAERATSEADKMAHLATAVTLFRGPFLPDMDANWVTEKREYFNRQFSDANLKLGNYAFEKGEYAKVLGYCQTLLSMDPGLEEAHRLAMRAHAARGNRAEVVRQFKLCTAVLKKEYGLGPSKESSDLYNLLTR